MGNNYNQPNRPQPQAAQPPQQVDPAMVQQWLETRKLEVQNEASQTRIREKEIEANSSYAHASLKHQAEYLKTKPAQDRKDLLLISGIAAFFVILLMGFVLYCLHIGEKDLVTSVLKGIGWVGTSVLSYYLGRNNNKKSTQSRSDSNEAEIVDE
ncbi:hypothetical protein [Spirosoma radiotolerans]|uniref:DUF2335 domain-containing protein n=1 Tax=Spirosoma radiotolerans TaxID=1379870 RepID=A0A0E3ZVB8_9BACT|nr:hypothetical protein [Spirosoma radiotolerans]AKD55034.1 hypothetical protein SD10_09080 [Spirosoma radiotolerans]